MRGTFEDLTNKTFGHWKVIARIVAPRGKTNSILWLCQCVCGKQRKRYGTNLVWGKNTGCGCQHWAQKRPYEALYNSLLRVAKKDGRKVELTYEEFLGFTKLKKCHYCKSPLTWAEKHIYKNGNNYNLDRMDNEKEYTRDNCVACCARCNRAKSNQFTYDEWKSIGRLIQTWEK